MLIDGNGNYIAGKDIDPESEEMGSIFDEDKNDALRNAGKEILANKFAEYRAQRETEANAMQQKTSTKPVENTTTQTISTQKPTD